MSLEENALTRRRAELEARGVRLADLTVTNPTECGLSPVGVALPVVDRYEPDALGARAAREAIARYARVRPEQLLLSASTSEAYAWLFKLLGGEVLVPAPCYPLLDVLAELERVTLRRYPLRYDGRWCTDVPVVAETATPETRAVVAISPGNPTGSYLHEAAELAEVCASRGWALIIDEVFAAPERTLAAREWPCLTFVLSGLSKVCGLPQLKLAWTSVQGPGAEGALDRLGFIADAFLSVNAPVQLAVGALLETHAAPFQRRVAERCAINRAALASRVPRDWQLLSAEAGWAAAIRVPTDVDEETRCLALLERGVVVHPGYFYDFPSGAHLVLSLLPEPERFAEGVVRLV